MKENSTNFRRLLRYIYQETVAEDSLSMVKEINDNYATQETYYELLKDIKCLPKIQLSPGPLTIHNILHHMNLSSLEAQL
ncbi:MAG TPA: hypothetical protein VK590_01670 [Saprospiraceae bacterium]|nr:hypothetical protein [Saprospiraceae bacterium]